jgi:hypothetical protein
MRNSFRYFNSSPEVIRLVVMMYVRYPLSLRNVEDLLAGLRIDISHETVRFWWNRFGPMFAAEIRKNRVAHLRRFPQRRWHLDEVFVKINGQLCGSGANVRRRSTAFHTAGASRPWTPRRPSPNCPLRMRCINSIRLWCKDRKQGIFDDPATLR